MPEGTLPAIKTLALIGAGLIGGSLALALRARLPDLQVRVFDLVETHSRAAVQLGIATQACGDPASAVRGADLVVLAAPVGALPALFATLRPHLADHAIVTDVGSTKANVLVAARQELGSAFSRFVPGHPISGAERSGPSAAQPDLFRGRRVVLTPVVETDASALARVTQVWESTGASVFLLEAAQHDAVFASVSHLPHLLSFALVDELAARPDAALLFSYAAGGFRDFTRIAASHPDMWRDIALDNRDALLAELDAYLGAVQTLRDRVAAGDGPALHACFDRARVARLRWAEGGA